MGSFVVRVSVKLQDPQFPDRRKNDYRRAMPPPSSRTRRTTDSRYSSINTLTSANASRRSPSNARRCDEGRKANRPQEDHARSCPARQIGGLRVERSLAHGTFSRRRRFRRRLRETGARQGLSSDLAVARKILNTWEVESGSVLASQEVHDLAVAIGCDPGRDDISGLRYGKVVILADADSDGLHIATLLSALFLKHFPSLVRDGHVFVAMPPLFRVDVGKQVFYCLDEAEREAMLQKIEREKMKGAINVTRFKGLGEMNPSQLRESTIDPDTRRLVQLTVDGDDGTAKLMDMCSRKARIRSQGMARNERRSRAARSLINRFLTGRRAFSSVYV